VQIRNSKIAEFKTGHFMMAEAGLAPAGSHQLSAGALQHGRAAAAAL
jgi:hypothetical protein